MKKAATGYEEDKYHRGCFLCYKWNPSAVICKYFTIIAFNCNQWFSILEPRHRHCLLALIFHFQWESDSGI